MDSASVYWTTLDAVMKVSISGGTPITLASGQDSPFGIAVDSTSVYWTTNDPASPGTGSVMRLTPK